MNNNDFNNQPTNDFSNNNQNNNLNNNQPISNNDFIITNQQTNSNNFTNTNQSINNNFVNNIQTINNVPEQNMTDNQNINASDVFGVEVVKPKAISNDNVINNPNNEQINKPINQPNFNNQPTNSETNQNITTNNEQVNNLEPITTSQINNNSQENNQNNNLDLVKEFVGEKYNKISKSSFSIPAFFLSNLYYFYRKMYLFGFLIIAVNTFILNTPLKFFSIAFNVVLGLVTNKLYLRFSASKVNKIEMMNKDKDLNELAKICAKKGGTSIGAAIGLTFLALVISIVVLLILSVLGAVTILSSMFGGLIKDTTSSILNPTDDVYEGVLFHDDSKNASNYFVVTIPNGFEKDDFGQLSYSYTTNSEGVFNKCEFSLNAVQNFSSPDSLIESMAEYNEASDTISSNVINNINWTSFVVNDGFGTTTYYRATEKDGGIFLLEYEIEQEADQTVCEQYYNSIISSISYK